MSRSGPAFTLLLALLALSGCAVGYNSTLFYTQSNIGIDAETKPPTAEISIARREGVIEPSFEGGQTPPVIAGFRNHSGPFSRFFFGVQSTFAGGDAAQGLSYGPNGPPSGLCLSGKPKPPVLTFLSIPEKNEVVPFVFGTDTVFGLKLAWSGTAGPFPDSLRLGFNRKEAAWAPLFGTDQANCTIPGTAIPGVYEVWMPSFLAAIDVNGQTGQPSEIVQSANAEATKMSPISVDWVQYFATGRAATTLSERDDVRAILLKQAFPAANIGTFNSGPETTCILNWLQTPENGKKLTAWWTEQQLPGNAGSGIVQGRYAAQQKQFMTKENISCK